jgi:RND family efflux transporter MFP subunit
MRTILALSSIGLALASGGCVDRAAQAQAKETEKIVSDPRVAVITAPARAQNVNRTVEITGEITSGEDSQVGAVISGRLISVFVKDGDRVTTGQVLAQQDTATLNESLRQAQAQVNAALAQVAQARKNAQISPRISEAQVQTAAAALANARSQYQKAVAGPRLQERRQVEAQLEGARENLATQQKELERVRTLVREGAVAANRLEQQENAVASARATVNSTEAQLRLLREGTRAEDIAAARAAVRQAEESLRSARGSQALDTTLTDQVNAAVAQVESAQATVAQVQRQIADATIRAPFSGTVSGKPAQIGQVLGPGTAILRLVAEGSEAYFEGDVPEPNLAEVSVGSEVQVRIDALRATLPGRVATLNPVGSSIGRLFKARIELLQRPAGLRSGIFARGVIILERFPDAVTVPATAIVRRDGKSVLFTLQGDTARAVPVTSGIRVGDRLQVRGVSAGAQVVVSGQESLDDGSKVTQGEGAATKGGAE